VSLSQDDKSNETVSDCVYGTPLPQTPLPFRMTNSN